MPTTPTSQGSLALVILALKRDLQTLKPLVESPPVYMSIATQMTYTHGGYGQDVKRKRYPCAFMMESVAVHAE